MSAILADVPRRHGRIDAASLAIALGAHLDEACAVTLGERLLLTELLDRLARTEWAFRNRQQEVYNGTAARPSAHDSLVALGLPWQDPPRSLESLPAGEQGTRPASTRQRNVTMPGKMVRPTIPSAGRGVLACFLTCWVSVPLDAQVASTPLQASDQSILVTGRQEDLTGIAASANQGTISAADIALRPILRPGEIVEQIPGVIITQHSGSGKANQYFLRGFNLDHGTDLAVSVDGVPVNMPSHAHGQGYADLNFLIPELVERVDYKKGPYYADVGDFGSAGAIDLRYDDVLPQGIARVEGGGIGYARSVFAGSRPWGAGDLLAAIELQHNDGPWVQGDNERKIDGVLRYSAGDARDGWSLTASAYHDRWHSTNQIPDRAVAGQTDPVGAPRPPAADLISRYGEIDPSDGGRTGRYALTADWRRTGDADATRLNVYVERYDLDLFSDFTYFLDDPVHGDQIEQQDRRWIEGGRAVQLWQHGLLQHPSSTTIGFDVRHDGIDNGLYHTEDRTRLSATAVNSITETIASPYVQNETRWTDWVRTVLGLRGDAAWMNVRNRAGGDSGQVARHILSPKVDVIFGPWAKTELYLDYGQGFHSNDARGVVSRVDPATALPRSWGRRLGCGRR